MQSAPRLTGWSGLPSSLTTRPSRLRASTPQPAGHSRHTVANHAATPGTMLLVRHHQGQQCLGRLLAAGAIAAAVPDVPTILKNLAPIAFDPPQWWHVTQSSGARVPRVAFSRRWHSRHQPMESSGGGGSEPDQVSRSLSSRGPVVALTVVMVSTGPWHVWQRTPART